MSKHIDSYRNYAYGDDLGVYGKWIGKALALRPLSQPQKYTQYWLY